MHKNSSDQIVMRSSDEEVIVYPDKKSFLQAVDKQAKEYAKTGLNRAERRRREKLFKKEAKKHAHSQVKKGGS